MNGSIAYVRRSIDAVVRLALRDSQALSLLDMTADGFYRSFVAMIVAAPLYAGFVGGVFKRLIKLAIANGHRLEPAELEFGTRDLVLEIVRYALLWLIFPVTALVVLRFLNQTARYSAMVIAYNWSAIIVMLLFNVPLALFGLGIAAPFPTLLLLFTVFGFALYYRFFLGVATLHAGSSTAMAVAAINALLTFYIVFGIELLRGVLDS